MAKIVEKHTMTVTATGRSGNDCVRDIFFQMEDSFNATGLLREPQVPVQSYPMSKLQIIKLLKDNTELPLMECKRRVELYMESVAAGLVAASHVFRS